METNIKKVIFFTFVFIISLKGFSQLPAVYDLRTNGMVTPVKDQGSSCGSCWAFATCAAIESQWLKLGYSVFDLSEDNLMDCHGFDEAPCAGGSFYMSQANLSMHRGIFTEVTDPYTPTTSNCPMWLSFPPSPVAHVEEMIFIPSQINLIKQAIIDYGAVASTVFFNLSNYNASKYKYYDSAIDSNDSLYAHCVTIAGWNDTMSFAGAPGSGGWIIKDSYGTSWAQNGYFYCSFYDAGILGENAVFPVRHELPAAQNRPHVYAYDALGWVDNTGYNNNIAWGLVKYTLTPSGGVLTPQQIKRVGTYATEDNTSIEISLWREKNGNILSGFIASETIFCDYKGFYTVPLNLKTDSLFSDIYIKIKYTCPAGTMKPVPVEILESGHTSGISLSTNSCWLSSDGSNWIVTGNGTSSMFDLCIKMYTENAQKAVMEQFPDSVCEGSQVILHDISPLPKDSCHWLINNAFYSNAPNIPYYFTIPGLYHITLVVWLGNNSDTITKSIQVIEKPAIPVISQNNNTLESTPAYAYQWLDGQLLPITGETSQIFSPPTEGFYSVTTYNAFGCENSSAPYNFYFTGLHERDNNCFTIFPNPTSDVLNIISNTTENQLKIEISDLSGRNIISIHTPVEKYKTYSVDCRSIEAACYIIKITGNNLHYAGYFIKQH
jgi:C1A family cysteine protease